MKKRTFAWKPVLTVVTLPLWIAPAILLAIIGGLCMWAYDIFEWAFPKTEEYERHLRDLEMRSDMGLEEP